MSRYSILVSLMIVVVICLIYGFWTRYCQPLDANRVVAVVGPSVGPSVVEPHADASSVGSDYVQNSPSAQYVGNAVCIGCHEKLGARWKLSYHAKAMDRASDQTVLADFNNASAVHFNSAAQFYKKGNDFWARVDIPVSGSKTPESSKTQKNATDATDATTAEKDDAGNRTDQDKQKKSDKPNRSDKPEYQVKYVLGFYPLQQYLVEFPNGGIQCLPYAWDVDGKRWYHLYADEPIPEGDILHWKQPVQNWNAVCADCHTTNLKRNYRFDDDSWHTTYTELNVGCEACHGPGSAHVEIAKRQLETAKSETAQTTKQRKTEGTRPDCGLFTFAGADGPTATDACSTCHARRREIYPGYTPGKKFCDFYFPELLDSDAFYPDGQIREEDYEYASFLQSRFYAQGGSCSDCHDKFIAKVSHLESAEGSAPTVKAICGRCHELAKYDSPAHHFHDIGKNISGTRCEDCHMPTTTYMQLDARRDHSIRIPQPQLTIDLNIPNACNRCHADKTPQWARDTCEKWYGKRDVANHFAYALAAGRQQKPEAQEGLVRVLRDETLPPLVRASAGRLLRTYSDPLVQTALIEQLNNLSELIRTTCVEALEGKFESPRERRRILIPLLKDPVRSVRLQAVRLLADSWSEEAPDVDATKQDLYKRVREEYLISLNNQLEHAAAHLNMGVLAEQENKPADAANHYRNALKRDERYLPALNNLGLLYYQQNNLPETERQFRRITELYPDQSDGWRFFGMVQAEIANKTDDTDQLSQAAESFKKALALNPNQPRLYYNLGLVLNQLKRGSEAIDALNSAIRLAPDNPQYRDALEYVRQTNGSK